ncbi:MAG TPA: DivIVA domain-containing protein [Gaiellaceae bacterium]|nr:DivIVA domain-containing protein [Gaiellaceae bacterium]
MGITPVEIRHVKLNRAPLGGYRRAHTERLLLEIADSFEEVWRERADLIDRVEQLEEDIIRYRDLETLLRQTLVSAERTSTELRDAAQKQAAVVVEEAHATAREILRAARAERERLAGSSARIRAQLEGALDVLGDADPAAEAA